jgi:hypothetical protein
MTRWLCLIVSLGACGHAAVGAPGTTAPSGAAPAEASPPAPHEGLVGPAFPVLRAFRAELIAWARANPPDFTPALRARARAFHAAHRAVLLAQAKWTVGRLPRVVLPDLATLPDDPRLTEAWADRARRLVAEWRDLEDREAVETALNPTDPIHTFHGVRLLLQGAGDPGSPEVRRANLLERLAPFPLVRLNDDLDHPILALPGRADLLAVWLAHDPREPIFRPTRIRWVRLDPASPLRLPPDRLEASLRDYALAVHAFPFREDDTERSRILPLLAHAGGAAERWLRPQAQRFLQTALTRIASLPHDPLPDLTGWREASLDSPRTLGVLGSALLFPSLRWDPLRAFWFTREMFLGRLLPVDRFVRLTQMDVLAPPIPSRASVDPQHPVLFLADAEAVFIMEYTASPARGILATRVRLFRRPGADDSP